MDVSTLEKEDPLPDCELLQTCKFFNDQMADMPANATLYKRNLCQGKKDDCARYMVFAAMGREKVPADLFPGQRERAKRIIAV